MNIKLAKQLKEAGFPIKKLKDGDGEGKIINYSDDIAHSDFAYQPTLSELIEACGEHYFSMEEGSGEKIIKGEWYAKKRDKNIRAEGKTPAEAVAKLWLKLNEKK